MAIQFLDAAEVAEIMEVSRTSAYRIIKKLNDELSGRGYITMAGKVSKKYFSERIYAGEELMKPQVYPTDERRAA